jgi:hypothetical protein
MSAPSCYLQCEIFVNAQSLLWPFEANETDPALMIDCTQAVIALMSLDHSHNTQLHAQHSPERKMVGRPHARRDRGKGVAEICGVHLRYPHTHTQQTLRGELQDAEHLGIARQEDVVNAARERVGLGGGGVRSEASEVVRRQQRACMAISRNRILEPSCWQQK